MSPLGYIKSHSGVGQPILTALRTFYGSENLSPRLLRPPFLFVAASVTGVW
jgi:hypothetical protein